MNFCQYDPPLKANIDHVLWSREEHPEHTIRLSTAGFETCVDLWGAGGKDEVQKKMKEVLKLLNEIIKRSNVPTISPEQLSMVSEGELELIRTIDDAFDRIRRK